MANALLDVFNMDLSYFQANAPVTTDIFNVIVATGWALLLGNLVFQATRSMASGIGFEGEEPTMLFTRTFVFGFLLIASRQICEIGLNITSTVMDLMQIPSSVTITTPDEHAFGFDGSWILVIIVGLILMFQIVKFFFEIGERYVVTVMLVVMAPLAFAMGGSKNTGDIFKGWCRMFGSMCVMMLMNVVFLKLLLSAMSTVPSGIGILPWLIFVVAIARVGRKVDDIVCRIGLNPARTGDPLGRGVPLAITMMVARGIGKSVAGAAAKNAPQNSGGQSGGQPMPGSSPRPRPQGSGVGSQQNSTYSSNQTHTSNNSTSQSTSGNTGATGGNSTAQPTNTAATAQSAPGTAATSTASTRPPIGRNRQDRQQSSQSISKGQQSQTSTQQNTLESTSGSATATPVQPTMSVKDDQSKATQPQPTRPPIQRTPRGNFPQPPVGTGTMPAASHSTQSISAGNQINQVASQGGSSTTIGSTSKTNSISSNAGNLQGSSRTAAPPISAGKQGVAGAPGTNTTGATRPPIGGGRNAAISQGVPTDSIRNSAPQGLPTGSSRNGAPQERPPSGNRNSAPQGLPTGGSRNSTQQERPSGGGRNVVSQGAPTGGSRNFTSQQTPTGGSSNSAPQGMPQSDSRNSTPQGAPTGGGRNNTPQERPAGGGRNSAPQERPTSSRNSAPPDRPSGGGRNEPPKRPPIGPNHKP